MKHFTNGCIRMKGLIVKISCILICAPLAISLNITSLISESFLFLQCFDIIFEPLCKELTRCLQKRETDGNAEHALSVAVFMLLVVKSNEIIEEASLKLIREFLLSIFAYSRYCEKRVSKL